MKILSVLGARPQFIKAAPVSRALEAQAELCEIIVHTGQHYDRNMSELFFEEMRIPRPKYNLGVGSASHAVQTAKMLPQLESVVLEEQPDWMLVYGDTNSTLAAALVAAKMQVPIAHVEAGLRSHNRRMPEEVNRVVADHLSSMLFAPTKTAVRNLLREGVDETAIHHVGDVMLDASLHFRQVAERESNILAKMQLTPRLYCLATIHRAENTSEAAVLKELLDILRALSRTLPVVLPLHPRTRDAVRQFGLEKSLEGIAHVVEPVGFLDIMMLESAAALIVTDSGGMQKEAYFFHVPCVTLRGETEWTELVECGFNFLAGGSRDVALRVAQEALAAKPDWSIQLYGAGDASRRIAALLARQK